MVVLDHKYGDWVPVQLGTLILEQLVVTMTTEKIQQAGETWKQVHLSTVLSKTNTVESLSISMHDLKGVKGKIGMMQTVVILPFTTIRVKGVAQLITHSRYMNVIIKPNAGNSDHVTIERSYGVLKPGLGKVDVCLQNHSTKQITLLSGLLLEKLQPQVPSDFVGAKAKMRMSL